MEKAIGSLGFESVNEFFLKLALPVFVLCLGLFFVTLTLLQLPPFVSYVFLLAGIGFVFGYPYIMFERKKVNIHENIHLFITYAGTISTVHLNRAMFFKRISSGEKYGEISKAAEKILYLAKAWNLGFAKTCRKIARYSPSHIFADFLDRFAAVLDFGEDLEVFLMTEQDAVMDDYENEYKQSLQNIGMLREVFIAMTISIAFAMSAALLLPLIMGISIIVVVKYCLLGLLITDGILITLIKGFIPSDRICSSLKIKDEGTKKIYKTLYIVFPISVGLLLGMLYINKLPFLINLAIGITPLVVVGIYAVQEEEAVFKRDRAFPAFIRALGGTIEVRQGGVISSIGALRVHDFGALNEMMIHLYRRLRLGSERFKSWMYFAAETGSNLINYFIHIFAESVYLGGNAEKVGQIISKNFMRLLSMRKLRLQLASGLRGALYGALVGFTATIYLSTSITSLLTRMFTDAMSASQIEGSMGGLVEAVLPAMPAVNMVTVDLYMGIMIIIHAFVSAMILKLVDGGNKFASLFDFTLMIWIGAVLSWVIPRMAFSMFGPMLGGA